MTLICSLLLFAFAILASVMHASMGTYMTGRQRKALETNAYAVATLAGAYSTAAELEDSWDFRMSMRLASEVSGADAVVCDTDGRVIACACRELTCEHLGVQVDPELIDQTIRNGSLFTTATLQPLYAQSRYLSAVLLTNVNDTAATGIVLVSAPVAGVRHSLRTMFDILWLTAIAVLAVAVLVTLYISRREAQPLRKLAETVRQFGHGDFSARAALGGRNTSEMDEFAAAFNTMAESLSEAERKRTEFVANVSHELKTPMTSIAGYMDGMLDGTIPQEQHAQYMRLVADEVRRLSRLVRNMLELARLQSEGIAPSDRSVFDLGDLVGQTLFSFEQKINARHLEVEAELPERALKVCAMRDAIAQVTYNLLDNAVKFCSDCGVLGVSVRKSGAKAVVTIRNTGVTIPPEELPLIFDRFHKLDKSRSRDRDGVGLGLWIVKTLLGAHGEDIWVESRDGVTAFSFTVSLEK